MALSGLKPPGPLNLNGDLAASWKVWYHSYNIYATAAGVLSRSEKIQCCVFLHVAGAEAQKVHQSMNFTATETDKIAPLREAFKTYCEGKTNLTVTRYKFNSYNQGTETMDAYIREVRHKVGHCQYGELEDSLMCDRLVSGIKCNVLRDRLLQTPKLTLRSCEEMCRMSEHRAKQLTENANVDYTLDFVRREGAFRQTPRTYDQQRQQRPQPAAHYITVCQQLGMVELDYFGLQYAGAKGEQLWLNMRNRISRQLSGSPPYRLRLRVKFFVAPYYLLQETARHQFFLQLRQDLYEDKLRLPEDAENTVAQMAACIAQAEVGDYRDHPSVAACYAAFLPPRHRDVHAHPQLQPLAAAAHARLAGTARETAEYRMLKAASTLESYGVEYHVVRSGAGVSLHIGVGPEGTALYDMNWKLVQNIPYPTVKRAIHSGKTLQIDALRDDGTSNLLNFRLMTDRAANALYRSLTEMHSFYRCDTVRRAVASQVSRDLKGTLASLFNENTTAGIMYEFDIQRTFIEAYDHARRKLYTNSLPEPPSSKVPGSNTADHTSVSAGNLCSTQDCQLLKSKLDRLQDELLCRVCMDDDVDTVFCPCGHVACCAHCADQMTDCPLCRQPISQRQHIFLPNLRTQVS